ncbi:MAG: cytochrome-c oxidase, cbb3-type subunit III [Burkholderiales bacterium]|nr:cytochrome-c oxidase, cbb3-type subunit III [Burkholderiales bacterium]
MAADNSQVDSLTGTSTTGHEWDGIRELNTPLPRWWLWLFYATIVWGIGYIIVYPAIPLGNTFTKGLFGYASRNAVEDDVAALNRLRGDKMTALASTPLADIAKNPQLQQVALAAGKAAFGNNCAPCHGTGGGGTKGYPNLVDDQWIWGGSLDQIQQTIAYGIRNELAESRQGPMPAFGKDGILKKEEIANVTAYVVSMAGRKPEGAVDLAKGKQLFADNCAACHGDAGKGNPEVGAPNLTSNIWLYGGEQAVIEQTIANGRGGVMPPWNGRLDQATINALTVYVHTLSGGK